MLVGDRVNVIRHLTLYAVTKGGTKQLVGYEWYFHVAPKCGMIIKHNQTTWEIVAVKEICNGNYEVQVK